MAQDSDAVIRAIELVFSRSVNGRACIFNIWQQLYKFICCYCAIAMDLNGSPFAICYFRQIQISTSIATYPAVENMGIVLLYIII